MPLYEYKCEKCGKVFEKIQKFSDAPLTVHEECGGAVERLLSPPALQFKGSGFYITDYKGGSAKPASSKSSDGGGASSSSSSDSGSSGSSSSTSSSAPASGSSTPASNNSK